MSPLLPAVGTVVGDDYHLVRLLGAGGMGAVFEATRGSERLALKLLTAAREPAAAGRFVREVRVAAAVRSPHLIRVLDAKVDGATGLPFFVMPFVEGRDLGGRLARVGPLAPAVAARLVLQAAKGLSALHASGVVHRDVKPSNLLLAEEGEDVRVLVCDFGVAKELDAPWALTATGSLVGTPVYMAPEQVVDAKGVDLRADLWSLGMTLYEALAGVTALDPASPLPELFAALAAGRVPPLQEKAPWVPPEIAVVVHGLLIVDRAERCPSAAALMAALRPFVEGRAEMRASELAALDEATRAAVAPRAPIPARWGSGAERPSASAPEATDPRIGTTVGGAYRLVRKLGQGGMGAVYEATGPGEARVAVKLVAAAGLEAARGDALVRRFVREIRAAMSVASEHVVRVIAADAEPPEGSPYLVMELLHGVDLATLVEQNGPLEPGALVRLFLQACEGLAAAHARGIVHRDMKPANLFLHEDDEGRIVVKVCDFGVAKEQLPGDASEAATLALTRTGGLLGSPIYMSPEQARNARHVDARTDVWSLSLSLYEALTGKRPWEECTTMGELVLAICNGDITPLEELAPWAPPALAEVVQRGLARELPRRWASIGDLAAALTRLATPGPVTRQALCSLSTEPVVRGTAWPGPARDRRGLSRTARSAGGVALAGLVAAGASFAMRAPSRQDPPVTAPAAVPDTTGAQTLPPASTSSLVTAVAAAPAPAFAAAAAPTPASAAASMSPPAAAAAIVAASAAVVETPPAPSAAVRVQGAPVHAGGRPRTKGAAAPKPDASGDERIAAPAPPPAPAAAPSKPDAFGDERK